MFCSKCGTELDDNAVVCPKCGVPTARAGAPVVANVPNHLVAAILATIFCCLIGGIVSIIYSTQVNTKLAQGDIAGAQSASRKALGWIIASICFGVVMTIFSFVLGVLLAIGEAAASV